MAKFRIYIGFENVEYMQDLAKQLGDKFDVVVLKEKDNIINEVLTNEPDLAILDYEIEQIDIFKLCEKLSCDYPEVNIVIYVSLEQLKTAKKKWRRRALDYIIGDIEIEEFCEEVSKVVRYIITERQREEFARNKIELRYVLTKNIEILKEMIDQLTILKDEAGIERCKKQLEEIYEILQDMTE